MRIQAHSDVELSDILIISPKKMPMGVLRKLSELVHLRILMTVWQYLK